MGTRASDREPIRTSSFLFQLKHTLISQDSLHPTHFIPCSLTFTPPCNTPAQSLLRCAAAPTADTCCCRQVGIIVP